MKKFIIQTIVLVVAIFGGLYFTFQNTSVFNRTTSNPTQPIKNTGQLTVGSTQLVVEVADTKEERSKGLGARASLASDSGMLFLFDRPDRYQFWMKGMQFALDFVWIKQGVVVDLLKNVPPPLPGQKDETLPIYLPNQDITSVLEVNSGYIDQHGIKIGDQATLQN